MRIDLCHMIRANWVYANMHLVPWIIIIISRCKISFSTTKLAARAYKQSQLFVIERNSCATKIDSIRILDDWNCDLSNCAIQLRWTFFCFIRFHGISLNFFFSLFNLVYFNGILFSNGRKKSALISEFSLMWNWINGVKTFIRVSAIGH